ncbi:MAG: hypothetical protein HKN32_09700 [Flavobacteriales bacterium]|nr:hypothetical protein [Flavobacteriales bacterium]
MPNFNLTIQVNGTDVRARATFPNACYQAAGGAKGTPAGQRVPHGNFSYQCFYTYDPNAQCAQTETTREWVLPYEGDASGEYLTVFLVESPSLSVKDQASSAQKVKE